MDLKEFLEKKYSDFENLLFNKNEALKIIAELEEKLKSEETFNIINIKDSTETILQRVLNTIKCLNKLSDGKYLKLLEKFKEIETQIKSQGNKEILKLITPLNLKDSSSDFSIENCQTIHDIVKFVHQMAMREMFAMWEKYDIENLAVPFQANIPISILILDLGGGIREDNSRKLTPENIVSLPFKAVLEGMLSIKWPEPRPVDAKGFLGMIAHTATISENELKEIAKKSSCIITKNYMNFSLRLGYHFSLIEAYVSESISNNYIKFFFKGGGAALDRRLRRVWLISEILKLLNFSVKIKNDVIDAFLMEYDKEAMEKRLKILGKLTGYTKQLDIVLFNDAVAEMYYKEFVKLHVENYL